MKMVEQVISFLKKNEKRYTANAWLYDDLMNLYVRKSRRHVDGEAYDALDIASIVVYKKGQGTFTAFLTEIEQACPYPVIYIENVLEMRFRKFLLGKGYKRNHHSDDPPSYYKRKEIVDVG